MKNSTSKILIAGLMILPLCGFGLPKVDAIGGSGSKTAQVDASAVTAEGAKLVASYIVAATGVLEGQKDVTAALDLKEETSNLEKQITAIKSGNLTSSEVNKTTELSESTASVIAEKMKSQTNLDADKKAKIASGLAKYATGVAGTFALVSTGKTFIENSTDTLASAPALQKASILKDLGTATSVAKEIPGLSMNLAKTGKQLIDFATKSGVDTSAATKNLSNVAGFN